jgi:hypothetical protein
VVFEFEFHEGAVKFRYLLNIDFSLFAGGGFPFVETLFTAIAAKGVL